MPTAQLPVVVVGTDPLCGWCFGIVDALAQARKILAGEVRFEVACGGLVTGERVRPVALDEQYLRRGLATVEQTTGRAATSAYFDGLLAEGTWISDSEPSVRAVVHARDVAGDDVALDLSSALSDALYLDGQAPDDPATLATVVSGFGHDGDAFVRAWDSDDARAATRAEMVRARRLGVQTYPSLLVEDGGRYRPVVEGYAPADVIVDRIRAAVLTG